MLLLGSYDDAHSSEHRAREPLHRFPTSSQQTETQFQATLSLYISQLTDRIRILITKKQTNDMCPL
jgi:hypothetical protein